MGLHELPGLLIHASDVLLELDRFDPPLAASADFDRRELATSDQCVDLSSRDAQLLGDIGEGEKARHDRMVANRLPDVKASIASCGQRFDRCTVIG